MAKRQKLSFFELNDMPDEILLKILTFLDIREIFKCGQVSQRIRAISNDESLWLQLNFFKGYVPYRLIEKAAENGCRYLSVAAACLYDSENSKMPLNLKYLEMSQYGYERYELPPGLLKNCHSLEKLAMENVPLDSKHVNFIGKNGQTLKVLDLSGVCPCGGFQNPTEAIKNLFKSCVELIELNFSNSWFYESELFTALVYNLTPKIMKVDFSSNHTVLKDRHVMTLVERCQKITELNLSFTSITNDCVDSIATHLNSSLEKLDVSHTKIDSTALLELKSVGTLKVLRCSVKNIKKRRNLRKNLPQVIINKDEYLSSIATSTSDTVDYENGFWEIKAKAQFADLNCS